MLLPLLLWTGCEREQVSSSEGIPDHCIEITLSGLHPTLSTKASSRGADAYNENLVKSVDCFFYPNGATGSNAVFSALGRGADAVAEGDSTVYKVKVFFTDADAIRMFGDKNSGTCQLYVICNAPLSYDLSHSSVNELKELVVENDFTAQTVQGSFVMSADETATVTLSTDGENNRTASGRVKVSRAAAKIQFFLLIPNEFLDEANQTWEPVLDAGIGISMSNAVKRGKVDGDYSVQAADYVSYGSRALEQLDAGNLITGHEDYKYSHVPFYSYPCAWSDLSDYATTVVFRIAWRIHGEENYQWKKYQLSPNISTLDLERNKYYRTFVNVRSLGGADKESLVIIPDCDYEIIPWVNESASGGGQGIVPGELITYKYLVFDHPEQTLNNETTVYFSYVSSSPITSVKINSIQYYVNSNPNPLQTQNVNRTITADEATVSTNAGDITINKENPGYVTFYHSLDDMYSSITIYATITNEDGCTQDVMVTQNPSIRLEAQYDKVGDVFVNGFFGHVTDATFGSQHRPYLTYHSTSNRDPNYYYHCNTGWSNDNNQNVSYNYNSTYQTGLYGTVTGGFYNLSESISRDFFTTLINISSFHSSDHNNEYLANGSYVEYRIGDPRVECSTVYGDSWKTVTNFYKYLTSDGPTASAWESPEKIMITSQAEEDRNLIAPRFLVSSGLNSTQTTNMDFNTAIRRAATYQEAGYPAGRWRIPSEAEVAFIVARQNDGTIPNLFATGSKYWAGSGRTLTPQSGGDITFADDDGSGHSARFIYDLWYWGEEASTTNVYHPNGHIYNYDASGNATLIL